MTSIASAPDQPPETPSAEVGPFETRDPTAAAAQPAHEPQTEPDATRAALLRGDVVAARRLAAQEHGDVLGRLCLALLGSQREASDLARASLEQAFVNNAEVPADVSVRVWLCTLARRRCAEFVARRRAAKVVGGAQTKPAPSSLSPTSDAAPDGLGAPAALLTRQSFTSQDLTRARRARATLAQIKPSEREALLLHYTCKLSPDEVAQVTGTDAATAYERLSNGLLQLRRLLTRDSSSESLLAHSASFSGDSLVQSRT